MKKKRYKKLKRRFCEIDDCLSPYFAKGYCKQHYYSISVVMLNKHNKYDNGHTVLNRIYLEGAIANMHIKNRKGEPVYILEICSLDVELIKDMRWFIKCGEVYSCYGSLVEVLSELRIRKSPLNIVDRPNIGFCNTTRKFKYHKLVNGKSHSKSFDTYGEAEHYKKQFELSC